MPKFRKKPVVIEAIQLSENPFSACIWAEQFGDDFNWEVVGGKDPHIIIPTKEGNMIAGKGDWIIREPFPTDGRNFYPCKPDFFEKTYDPF